MTFAMSVQDLIVILGGSFILVAHRWFVWEMNRKRALESVFQAKEKKEQEELSWREIGNFSWLDTCPSCGAIDNHPFQTLEDALDNADESCTPSLRPITIVNDDIHLPVVERTCTNTKCKFKWLQH